MNSPQDIEEVVSMTVDRPRSELPLVRDSTLLRQASEYIPANDGSSICLDLMPGTPFLCCRELDHDGPHVATDGHDRAFALWPLEGFGLLRDAGAV